MSAKEYELSRLGERLVRVCRALTRYGWEVVRCEIVYLL